MKKWKRIIIIGTSIIAFVFASFFLYGSYIQKKSVRQLAASGNEPLNVANQYDGLLYRAWNTGSEEDVKKYIDYLYEVSTPSFKISIGTKENMIKKQFEIIKREKANGVRFIKSNYEDPEIVDDNTVVVIFKDSFSDGDRYLQYTLVKDDGKWFISQLAEINN